MGSAAASGVMATATEEAGMQADDIRRVRGKIIAATATIWLRTPRRTRLIASSLVLSVSSIIAIYLYLSLSVTMDAVELPEQGRPSFSTLPVPPPEATAATASASARGAFNESKVALLIENRPMPLLAPLMLHFISVVPADWRFRFMGSAESVQKINGSAAIREQVASGKLDLTYIPSNMSTAGQEMISRFLTNLWLYETVLKPAEWLLVFQTDSVLCANSRRSVDDYLEYDWIGAPWHPDSEYGGNGGLSLRRVSAIVEILRQHMRADDSEPEDVWLAERLNNRPGAKMANWKMGLTFSGELFSGEKESVMNYHSAQMDGIGKSRRGSDKKDEARSPSPPSGLSIMTFSNATAGNNSISHITKPDDEAKSNGAESTEGGHEPRPKAQAQIPKYSEGVDDYRDGFYEPMGYHTGGSGKVLHSAIWGSPELRRHIWDYCPEIKITLVMDAARYVPGGCHSSWKRRFEQGEADELVDDDGEKSTEIIDGVEYPVLPRGLVPW